MARHWSTIGSTHAEWSVDNEPMRDRDIRTALRQRLMRNHENDVEKALIVDELPVCLQSVRADLAVVNGRFSGYEIKSDRDTLRRLERQQNAYSKVFDFATVVAASKHVDVLRTMIPDWWGITEVTEHGGTINFAPLQSPRQNPNVCPLSMAQFLWRSEALDVLRERGLERGLSRKPRRELWEMIAEIVPINELRDMVSVTLRARPHWPVRVSRA